ncbi:UNVERIFIED_CONTAM: Histone-lysine N-methyltransferase SUVR3 [Sesamum radiatum]|uniref:Histone-lysine N-methyltransferase SUVR3 n=1 Tax=Sesamum radiatum TaxID=300843 RepID=A0AAW2J3G5_SESRA
MRINIDAMRIGSIARFINHSCDGGNLDTVIMRSFGALLPCICFFTSKDFRKTKSLLLVMETLGSTWMANHVLWQFFLCWHPAFRTYMMCRKMENTLFGTRKESYEVQPGKMESSEYNTYNLSMLWIPYNFLSCATLLMNAKSLKMRNDRKVNLQVYL